MPRWFFTSFWLLLFSVLLITDAQAREDLFEREDVQTWIADFAKRADLDPQYIIGELRKANKLETSITSMDAPLKSPPAWHEYAPRFLNKERISDGVRFWRANQKTLARAQRYYGVPPEIIVAIIGVETNYGKRTGRYRLIDSLTTLAFDYPRRATYFRGELEELLLMSRDNGFAIDEIFGSYAGAMGLPQFMPKSYRHYAVDFDGNGRIDLWNADDAIGSVAAYLKEHGWQAGGKILAPTRRTNKSTFKWQDNELSEVKPLRDWQKQGITAQGAKADDALSLFRLEVAPRSFHTYAAFDNFRVILRYNRSKNYASAVAQLAQKVRGQMTDDR